MSTSLVVCYGFELGNLHVPPFELRPGEALTIQLPKTNEVETLLRSIVSGKQNHPRVETHGAIISVEPARPSASFLRWFRDIRPLQWLVGHGLTPERACEAMSRHQIDNRHPLSRHAATPRLLLALEVAYAREPAGIVFDVHGLDPNGRTAAIRLVQQKLPETAAIFFAGPLVNAGVRGHESFPDSTVVKVVEQSFVPA